MNRFEIEYWEGEELEYLEEGPEENLVLTPEQCPGPRKKRKTDVGNTVEVSSVADSNKKRRMNCRTDNFTPEEIKKLAMEVRKRPLIWDLSNNLHCVAPAVHRAWTEIGSAMNKPTTDCKQAWTSLRQRHRYRKVKGTKTKSGSEGGVHPEEPNMSEEELTEWEFSKDLDFLPDIAQKRRTYTTSSDGSHPEPRKANKSNYAYTTSRVSSMGSHRDESAVEKLAESVGQLINNSLDSPPPPEQPLVRQVVLANFDRLMQKLPEPVVEDVCFEIYSMLYRKIKEHENKNNSI